MSPVPKRSASSKASSRGSQFTDKRHHSDALSSEEWSGEASDHPETPIAPSGLDSDGEGMSNSGVPEPVPEPPPPQLVCGTVWFDSDKVAPEIR